MIKELSKSGKFHAELKKKGENHNPEIFKAVLDMNRELLKFRRDYRIKEINSNISASKIILMM